MQWHGNSMNDTAETANWKSLSRLGASAALLAIIFFRRYLSAELMAFSGFGIFDVPKEAPVTAIEWFTLLQESKFVGLALLDIFDLVNYALVGLIFLALYAALRKADQSAMRLATIFSIVGITVYFASNQALSSTRHTTCLPASAALVRYWMNDGLSPMR